MKEIRSIIKAYKGIDFEKNKAALVTVVRIEGSSYRRTGARMLVLDNGIYLGGISGGCLEGDALRKAQKALFLGKPSIVTYDTTQEDEHQIGVGLGCNGVIDVLFTPLNDQNPDNPVQLLSSIVNSREPHILVTITSSLLSNDNLAAAFLYNNDETFLNAFPFTEIHQEILKDIKLVMLGHDSATFIYETEEGPVSVFIEYIEPSLQFIIYGSNYDIYPMIRIANELGWDITLVMHSIKAEKSLFQYTAKIIDQKSGEQPAIDEYSAVMLMAHDYKTDLQNLRQIVNSKAFYIGLLGPRKRSEKMFRALEEENSRLSEESMNRIFSPAGLDIGADTPEEIALSVIAEVRAHFAGRNGMSLRSKKGTIHEY